jgi:hypothetical protein
VLTLATVNANVGSFGSATAAPTFTVNGKGLITAAGSATITPAVGSITGLGTGVPAALAINVGTAGAPVVLNGALGTPASGVATNLTGTASGLTAGNVLTNANLTGEVTSVGNAATLTNSAVIGKVLTGYVSGAGTVAATDSILQAVQKLNGNDANLQPLDAALTALAAGSDFVQFTGPATSTKVFTLPNASSTILTSNAVVTAAQGGTGVANANTITLAGNLTTAGANALTLTSTAATNVTLPTTGTLATLAGTEALSNKTITASAFNGTVGATTPSTGAFTTLAIGTNSAFGGTLGQFNGSNVTIAAGGGQFSIGTTNAAAADMGGSLGFTANTTSLAGYSMGNISARLIATGAGVYRSYMAFATTDTGGTIADRMRLTDAGLAVTGVITPKLATTTYATLPSAATAGAGAMIYISDCNSTTRLATAAGGGANKVLVYSDGTNWLIL